MPNIRTYTAPALGLQPSDEGVRATAAAGARIGRNFDQLASSAATVGNEFAKDMGEAVKDVGQIAAEYTGRKNRADLAAASTSAFAEADKSWNDAAALAVKEGRPDDPSLLGQFNDRMDSVYDKLRDAAWTDEGQRFVETRIAEMRQHFAVKTAADLASMAKTDITNKINTLINTSTGTAYSDPSSIQSLLDMGSTSIDAMVSASGLLTAVQAAKVRTELGQHLRERIVEAGIMGAVAKSANPEAAVRMLGEKYADLISGDKLKILYANARQQVRAARIDQQYYEHQAEKAAQQASDKRETDYLQRLYSDDPQQQNSVSTRAIVNDPLLSRTSKERMIGIVKRELEPETAAQESNRNYLEILQDIRSGRINNVDDIYAARVGRKINRSDFNQAIKDFTDFRSPEGQRIGQAEEQFINAVKGSITKANPLLGKTDPTGDLELYRLRMDVKSKIDEYRKAGKDWRDLFNPRKPDFMGSDSSLTPYQKSMTESVGWFRRLFNPGSKNPTGPNTTITGVEVGPTVKVEPRKPGESAADYLKRTGGR